MGPHDGARRNAPHRHRQQDLVRDDAVLEVDPGDRDQHGGERELDHEVVAEPVRQDDGAEDQARDQLDQRVAGGDARRAVTAAAAQEEPRDDRQVVPGPDRRVAAGAVRGRGDERLSAREAVGDDVQERPDDQSEGGCDGDFHLFVSKPAGRETRRRRGAAGRRWEGHRGLIGLPGLGLEPKTKEAGPKARLSDS